MSRDELVSVVIIFLDAQKFLAEAIESVIGQTYAHWELLLVDDGSTDRSSEIALEYVSRLGEKARYLEHLDHRNEGMSASRNLGIKNANGSYVALLDSDDVWLPHKLAEQVAVLRTEPDAAMVYGPSLKWYSWTGNDSDRQLDALYDLRVPANTLVRAPGLLTAQLRGEVATPCPSNILFRRSIWERVGGFEESFRESYQLYEDQAFLAKVHLRHTVFVADKWWDRYRKHSDSCVSLVRKAGKAEEARRFYLNWLERYLSEQEMEGTEVWHALRSTLWSQRNPLLYRMRATALNLGRRITSFSER